MPAPPKFRDGFRAVWRIEVLCEHEPKHQAEADRHVRIAAEIKVNLECVCDRTIPSVETTQDARVERGIRDLPAGIRQQDFLCHAKHEERRAAGEFFPSERPLAKLIGHVLKPDDRPGYELGKHRHVTDIVDEVFHDLGITAIDVDHITHALEGIKTDPERQYHAEKAQILRLRNAQCRHHRVIVVKTEIEVLEEAEDREIGDYRNGDEEFLTRREFFHQPPVGVVDRRIEKHQKAKVRVRPTVEEIAEERQHCMLPIAWACIVTRQHCRKKEEEKKI